MSDIDKTIAELEALKAKAASIGWEVQPGITPVDNHIYGTVKGNRGIRGKIASHLFLDVAALIVATHNALPKLIAEIRRLQDALMLEEEKAIERINDTDCGLTRLAELWNRRNEEWGKKNAERNKLFYAAKRGEKTS